MLEGSSSDRRAGTVNGPNRYAKKRSTRDYVESREQARKAARAAEAARGGEADVPVRDRRALIQQVEHRKRMAAHAAAIRGKSGDHIDAAEEKSHDAPATQHRSEAGHGKGLRATHATREETGEDPLYVAVREAKSRADAARRDKYAFARPEYRPDETVRFSSLCTPLERVRRLQCCWCSLERDMSVDHGQNCAAWTPRALVHVFCWAGPCMTLFLHRRLAMGGSARRDESLRRTAGGFPQRQPAHFEKQQQQQHLCRWCEDVQRGNGLAVVSSWERADARGRRQACSAPEQGQEESACQAPPQV